MQAVADAGYWSGPTSPSPRKRRVGRHIIAIRPENGQTKNCYGKEPSRSTQITPQPPGSTPMRGPYADANGRTKWIGVVRHTPEATVHAGGACSDGQHGRRSYARAARPARRPRALQPPRATVEPVFSAIEDTMAIAVSARVYRKP
jgi:hypothetical protein